MAEFAIEKALSDEATRAPASPADWKTLLLR
jgi:hypothetical protein